MNSDTDSSNARFKQFSSLSADNEGIDLKNLETPVIVHKNPLNHENTNNLKNPNKNSFITFPTFETLKNEEENLLKQLEEALHTKLVVTPVNNSNFFNNS
jgi:hypothetical protein